MKNSIKIAYVYVNALRQTKNECASFGKLFRVTGIPRFLYSIEFNLENVRVAFRGTLVYCDLFNKIERAAKYEYS